jgi:hypothetical protein
MVAVWMVKVTFHEVICVVAVRNRFVSTIGPMFVSRLMGFAVVIRGTRRRILRAYADLVLVNMALVLVMEVPIMKVILVAVVLHGRMSAVLTVNVIMRLVDLMFGAHRNAPYDSVVAGGGPRLY